MTEGGVGVWEKMTNDNDRGGNSRKLYHIKNRAWSKLFNVLGVWGGEELAKIVDHTKGAQKQLQCSHANIPNRSSGGQTCLYIFYDYPPVIVRYSRL